MDGRSLWRDRALGEGGRLGWRIGPLRLWIERRQGDWRLSRLEGEDPAETGVEDLAGDAPADEPGLEARRWVGGRRDDGLRLRPRLPDRAVVYRPQQPVYLLAGEEAQAFVSVPLWLDVELRPSGRRIDAGPFHRPSDTWFGADTLSGELCYASRTTLRLRREELPEYPHRAVCALTVVNHGADALAFHRLRLPVDLLGLHERDGRLQTEDLLLVREAARELTEIRTLTTVAGRPAGSGEPLALPRRRPEAGGAFKELQSIFGL